MFLKTRQVDDCKNNSTKRLKLCKIDRCRRKKENENFPRFVMSASCYSRLSWLNLCGTVRGNGVREDYDQEKLSPCFTNTKNRNED